MKTSNLKSIMSFSAGLNVLFVEDEANLRHEMTELLEDIFSKITVAKNGKEGIAKYKACYETNASYPDIVISDINMPYMSGVEMSREILSLDPEQTILILSAYNETKHILELLNIGVDGYALKPIEYHSFLQTLQRASQKVIYRKAAKAHTKELEFLAYHDSLTGISNRRYFFKKAKVFLLDSKPHLPPYTLCMFDLDSFKVINDSFGHDMGDAVLCKFTKIIESLLDPKECFARLGGDEFIVILQRNENDLKLVLAKIHANIVKTHHLLGKDLRFSVSTGMTQLMPQDKNIDSCIKRADMHLYEEKASKKQHSPEYMI